MENVTVRDIVEDYLDQNSLGGLYSEECACDRDDLFPCGSECIVDCKPGHRWPCTRTKGGFHVGPEIPLEPCNEDNCNLED